MATATEKRRRGRPKGSRNKTTKTTEVKGEKRKAIAGKLGGTRQLTDLTGKPWIDDQFDREIADIQKMIHDLKEEMAEDDRAYKEVRADKRRELSALEDEQLPKTMGEKEITKHYCTHGDHVLVSYRTVTVSSNTLEMSDAEINDLDAESEAA